MNPNVWKKRGMKIRGLVNQAFSGISLRYTPLHASFLKKDIQTANINKLHVGCGNVILDGWLNIFLDHREEYGRLIKEGQAFKLNYNLLKPWPVDNQAIRFISGSHFIEHLDLNDGIKFLKEAYRVMQSGGIIRLSCPDLEIYARHYVNGNKEFFNHPLIREWCTFKNAQTPGEIFIAKAYDSGLSHRWFYDLDSLKHILELTGFKNIRRCQRLEGQMLELARLEPKERELETLYVEATKI
jgi:predicted SAM-dependent methyltransferase